MKLFALLGATLCLGSVLARSPACVRPAAADAAARKTHTLPNRGGWNPDTQQRPAARRWTVQLTRGENNTVTGRVTLAGSPLATTATVHGQIADDAVYGVITDAAGNDIAAFDGTITPTGIRGKYMDRTGETGDWTSDPLPR